MERLFGSICLSDIDKSLIKRVECRDGKTRLYVNVSVVERKQPSQFGNTHFISCEPRREERREGANYIIGDLKRYDPQPYAPTAEQVAAAPPMRADDDLPF